MNHVNKKSSRNIGLEYLDYFLLIILPFECGSTVQKSLEKNHIITIASIHPQASRTDQLPGRLQRSREEAWGLIASSLVASLCAWSCCRSWVTSMGTATALPSSPNTAALQHHAAAYALPQPPRYKTALKWQSTAHLVHQEMLLYSFWEDALYRPHQTKQTSSNKAALRPNWSLEVLQNTPLTVNTK